MIKSKNLHQIKDSTFVTVCLTDLIKETTNSSAVDIFSKVVNIENQSPRSVILNWNVYIQFNSNSDPLGPGEVLNTKAVTSDSNLVEGDDIGIFEIVPKSMTIPAFKIVPLKIKFRPAKVGSYDGIAIANVAYLEPSGELRYALVKPNTKLYEKSLARIHIQSKVIEPRLTLEEMDIIRIKRKIKVHNQENTVGFKTADVFLKNNSDAICSFQIITQPTESFTFKSSSSKFSKLSSHGDKIFQLKPTEQMLIAVSFNPNSSIDDDGILYNSSSEFPRIDSNSVMVGELIVTFSNGMEQRFPIEVRG